MKREQTTLQNTEFVTATGNYDTSRAPIDRIIIHSTVGTVQSAITVFGNPANKTSAHYIVGNDGSLWQGLEEFNTAYHSGNYAMNQRSIGIEHEWYSGIHPSDALYAKSAALVKDICTFYNIPIDRTHILKHSEVVATGCPNEIDVDKIVQLAGGLLNPIPPISDCPKDLSDLKIVEKDLRDAITRKDDAVRAFFLGLPEADKTISDFNQQMKFISDSFLNLTTSKISTEQKLLQASEDLLKCQQKPDSSQAVQDKLNVLQKRYDKLASTPSKAIISILLKIAEGLKIQL